jgi:hypothetical protein
MNKSWLLPGLILGFLMSVGNLVADDPSQTKRDIYVPYPELRDAEGPAFYYQQVLRLALEKTRASHGDFQLHFSNDYYSMGRATQMLINRDKADVMWASVTPDREQVMRVIPYDLLRGLSNYRALIIRPDRQKKFMDVHNLQAFKKLTSGGGSNWTATRILRMQGIKVSTAPKYESVLKMLAAGRFDYISRGLHEAQADLTHGRLLGLQLAVEEGILLKYKHPVSYSFFVSKQNLALAERLTAGLQLAEEDGSLEAEFMNIKVLRDAFSYLDQNRRIFVLDNSALKKPSP